jgi:Domain of unknown function (DUF4430)
MTPQVAWLASATVLACAVAVAGCGFGAGPSSSGTATLTVTRDYGAKTLRNATDPEPPSSETVIRFLDDEADIATRYGGGFVQSIDGLAGNASSDWFFYVNGIESPVGAAEVHVKGGDRIWWDYRNWSAAMSVPAVVGSWPEPFAQASADEPKPVRVVCLGVRPACATAADRLGAAGVSAQVEHGASASNGSDSVMRMLVGPWTRVARDPAVDSLHGGPASTGVFATFKGPSHGTWHLIGLDQAGDPSRDLESASGLVAALRTSGGASTWIVTGSGSSAVGRAAAALDAGSLRNRYAIAATPHGAVPLPIVGKGLGG